MKINQIGRRIVNGQTDTQMTEFILILSIMKDIIDVYLHEWENKIYYIFRKLISEPDTI